MYEIQCLIFELYTNMVGWSQISHNSYLKRFFVQVLSCITTWKGCTLKILTFIFLHWFMQCPGLPFFILSRPIWFVPFQLQVNDQRNNIPHETIETSWQT